MGFHKRQMARGLAAIPSFSATFYSAPAGQRYTAFKGMGAKFMDVTPGYGELEFTMKRSDYLGYLGGLRAPAGFDTWDAYFLDYFRKLHDRHPTNWIMLLRRPETVFLYKGHGGYPNPASLTVTYLVKIFAENGYKVQEEHKR